LTAIIVAAISNTNLKTEVDTEIYYFRCEDRSRIFAGDNFYADYDCVMLDVRRAAAGCNAGIEGTS